MSGSGQVPLYDRFSADYDTMVDWTGRLEREWPFLEHVIEQVLRSVLPSGRAARVLDVGCATGAHAVYFAQKGHEVVGADPSAPMLQLAARRAQGVAGVSFVRAGFGDLRSATTGDFDLVTCLGNTLPHVLDAGALRGALEDIAAVLRPGGALVVQQLNYDRICATRQRFLALTSGGAQDEEVLFFRFYDFADPLLTFNVVTLRRPRGGAWAFNVESTQLRPVLQAELASALADAGFRPVAYYGTYERAPFDPATSNDLILVAITRRRRPKSAPRRSARPSLACVIPSTASTGGFGFATPFSRESRARSPDSA